jgi:hypothetical protein
MLRTVVVDAVTQDRVRDDIVSAHPKADSHPKDVDDSWRWRDQGRDDEHRAVEEKEAKEYIPLLVLLAEPDYQWDGYSNSKAAAREFGV